MNFSKFTNEELENMLKKQKEELTRLMENSNVHSQAKKVKMIEREIERREKDGETK